MLGYGHQIAHMDIPGAGDDLQRFCFAGVDLADPHMIAVGMALHGQDAAHHHIGEFSAQIRGGFHLGTGQSHCFVKGLVVSVYGDEFIQPFSG